MAIQAGLTVSPLMVYPSPATGPFRIKGLETGIPYQVIDINGKIVKEAVTNNATLQNSPLRQGTYTLRQGGRRTRFVQL